MTVQWPDILIADPGLAIWRSSIVSANGGKNYHYCHLLEWGLSSNSSWWITNSTHPCEDRENSVGTIWLSGPSILWKDNSLQSTAALVCNPHTVH